MNYIDKRHEEWHEEEPRLMRNGRGQSQATKNKTVVSYKYWASIGIRVEVNVGGLDLKGAYS